MVLSLLLLLLLLLLLKHAGGGTAAEEAPRFGRKRGNTALCRVTLQWRQAQKTNCQNTLLVHTP